MGSLAVAAAIVLVALVVSIWPSGSQPYSVGTAGGDSSGTGVDSGGAGGGGDTGADDEATTTPPTPPRSPEYIASNEACPAGLPTLEPTPIVGQPLVLEPFVDLVGVTVLAFSNPANGPAANGAAANGAAASGAAANGAAASGFVGTRTGVVWSFIVPPVGESPQAILSEFPLIDLSEDTAAEHDQGLVGMAIDPSGRWLYLNRTAGDGGSVLTAYAIDYPTDQGGITGVTLGAAIELLSIPQPSAQHNGGDIVFGPQGYMYVSFGDGGGLGDPFGNAQNLTTALGAVLRLSVDPSAAPQSRVLPAPGNPYLVPPADGRIWVSGVRNPYRMSYDPVAQQLWVSDVGQQCMEEITVLNLDEGGADLGWNVFEGNRPFVGTATRPHRQPDFEYRHGRGLCSVVGGQVYRGTALADFVGQFVWADLCGGRLYALNPDDLRSGNRTPGVVPPVVDLGVMAERILGVVTDPQGELYVVDLSLGIFRLLPADAQ